MSIWNAIVFISFTYCWRVSENIALFLFCQCTKDEIYQFLMLHKVYIYKKQQIPTNLKIYWRSATCIISCIIVFDKETRLLKKRVGDWYASIRSYLLRFLERVQGWPYRNKNLHRHRKGWRETLDACLATAQQPKRKKLYKCLCTKKRCFKRQLS